MNDQLFTAPIQPATTDERFTPGWVFDGLGLAFDLDPASPVDHDTAVPAARKLTIHDDGLTAPWSGLVWLNPPYSQSALWVDRFIGHGSGVFLGPYANSRWLWDLVDVADLVVLSSDFAFTHPVHTGQRAGMALMFVALGPEAVAGLRRLCESGRHRMTPLVAPDWA